MDLSSQNSQSSGGDRLANEMCYMECADWRQASSGNSEKSGVNSGSGGLAGVWRGIIEALWWRGGGFDLDKGKILVHRNLSHHTRKGGP